MSTAPGHVRLSFAAHDVYLVAGPESRPVQITMSLDGHPAAPAARSRCQRRHLDIAGQQLYHLLTGIDGNRHLIDLTVPAGFRLYTFTFG